MADIDVTRIAGNIGAMNSLNALNNINKQLSIHQTRLSTGKRINSAADDPAGLTIATKMFSRSEGLKIAMSNIGDAKNLLAVAESGLGRINDILVQMRNKAQSGASDTQGVDERAAIRTQLQAYAKQIDDLVAQTKWNGNKLLDGLVGYTGNKLTFQTGADKDDTTVLDGLSCVEADDIGVGTKVATSTATLQVGATTLTSAAYNVAADFANVDELSSDTYTISVHVGTIGAANTVKDSYVQIKNSAGAVMKVDDDGTGGGILADKLTFAYVDAGKQLDLGNGLRINIKAACTTATDFAGETVTYVKAGDYDYSSLVSATDFSNYLDKVTTAMTTVNQQMSKIGALTGRLTFKEDQVSAAQINTEAAYNRVMNANMAEEQVNASKYQILQQTATAMLSQANAAPQFLLSLFR